ncbi:MAG TPA: glycosyltransferase family 4 protein [Polyangiales bacterium]|nr:glycosyltransferase family 4 protein [Polyangiales bacterium]
MPDPASVGQHMHDVATEMVRRGTRVVVFTSDRGYDDPSQRYPSYELLDGVHVVRLPLSHLGKRSIGIRVIGGCLFMSEAVSLALTMRRIDHVLVSTSPPMCGIAGATLSRLRKAPLTYWIMDLNPDQIVATGGLAADAAPVRAFEWANQLVLSQARRVVALDRYMAERVASKYGVASKLVVLAPWSHLDPAEPPLPHERNAFRSRHGFDGTRVVMYSGNLSPVHPITTFLDAARSLADDPKLRFVFVGGGLGREEIERVKREHQMTNLQTLPYQPFQTLRESLSAADLHLVAMGDEMVGIVHPCKIYGAMAVGRPVLALGPERSHIVDLVRSTGAGWHAAHGDVAAVSRTLRELVAKDREELADMGRRAQGAIEAGFSRRRLLGRFCDLLEDGPATRAPTYVQESCAVDPWSSS